MEIADTEIDGISYRPSSTHRRACASCSPVPRARDATFLVYEDERWSFADVMRHLTRWLRCSSVATA